MSSRCTILALFFGLRGGFIPFILQKSSSISLRDSETENFRRSPFSDPYDLPFLMSVAGQLFSAAKGEGEHETELEYRYRGGDLHAALRVLRFHGMEVPATSAAAVAEERDLSASASFEFLDPDDRFCLTEDFSGGDGGRFLSARKFRSAASGTRPMTSTVRSEERLQQRRMRWVPQLPVGKVKLCSLNRWKPDGCGSGVGDAARCPAARRSSSPGMPSASSLPKITIESSLQRGGFVERKREERERERFLTFV